MVLRIVRRLKTKRIPMNSKSEQNKNHEIWSFILFMIIYTHICSRFKPIHMFSCDIVYTFMWNKNESKRSRMIRIPSDDRMERNTEPRKPKANLNLNNQHLLKPALNHDQNHPFKLEPQQSVTFPQPCKRPLEPSY